MLIVCILVRENQVSRKKHEGVKCASPILDAALFSAHALQLIVSSLPTVYYGALRRLDESYVTHSAFAFSSYLVVFLLFKY